MYIDPLLMSVDLSAWSWPWWMMPDLIRWPSPFFPFVLQIRLMCESPSVSVSSLLVKLIWQPVTMVTFSRTFDGFLTWLLYSISHICQLSCTKCSRMVRLYKIQVTNLDLSTWPSPFVLIADVSEFQYVAPTFFVLLQHQICAKRPYYVILQ